jgi:hypothetical protein
MHKWAIASLILFVVLLQAVGVGVTPVRVEAREAATGAVVAAASDEEREPILNRRRWSPYLVGVGLGVLSWLSFLLIDSGLGASSAYARTGALMEGAVRNKHRLDREYYVEHLRPLVNPGLIMAAGIIAGAFISAQLSGDFQFRAVPAMWAAKFGTAPSLRFLAAFIGGAIMAVGARWAGGCTSGHGITGTLQLALSSWVAVVCFFIGGVFTALLLYHS